MANDKKKMVEAITAQEVDFAQWYTDICTKAELVEYSSVKGFVVLRPYGYAIWGQKLWKNYLPDLAKRRLKRSTRPPVSTSFCLPV